MHTLTPRTTPWWLVLTSSLVISACGGSQDPILGMGQLLTLAPSVSATAPLASNPVVTGVATNTRVTATFNKPMSPTSLNTDTFTLQCPAGTSTTSSVGYDTPSRVATLTPATNLPAGTSCTATVTTGAQDTNGVALPANFSWAFVTGSSSDITRPTVTQQVPAQGAVAAATNTQLSVTFSEEMTPSSLNAGSFTLKTSTDTTPVPGTVGYAVGTRTATFSPTNALPTTRRSPPPSAQQRPIWLAMPCWPPTIGSSAPLWRLTPPHPWSAWSTPPSTVRGFASTKP